MEGSRRGETKERTPGPLYPGPSRNMGQSPPFTIPNGRSEEAPHLESYLRRGSDQDERCDWRFGAGTGVHPRPVVIYCESEVPRGFVRSGERTRTQSLDSGLSGSDTTKSVSKNLQSEGTGEYPAPRDL